MTLKIVDVAVFQSVTASTDVGADGAIIKATQGTGYVNPSCNAQYAHAKKNGLLLGLYHYAGGGDPVAEADYFLKNIGNYIGEAMLVLDWEHYQNAQYTNPNWARAFVNRVHEKTGVWCVIYGNKQDIQFCASCANDCALWFAGYPDLRASWNAPAFPYNIAPWKTMIGWQFTTSNSTLDRSIFYISKEEWKAFAKGSGNANAGSGNGSTTPSKPSEGGSSNTGSNTGNTTNATILEENEMKLFYTIDGKAPVRYFDGQQVRNLAHPDEQKILNDIYKANVGKDIPTMNFSSKAPYYRRLLDAINRTPEK